MVIGEPIVDTYVFCEPQGISSKSPSISAKYLYQEDYAGGSLAIANHLSSFVNHVRVYFTHGGEEYFRKILKSRMAPNVTLCDFNLPNIPTPRKTRFIEAYKSQRIFEITDLVSDQWEHHSADTFCDLIRKENRAADVVVVADFGHGLIEKSVLRSLEHFEGFVSLNVQTNSSNFGHNPFTKHRRFSFLNVDTREVRIAFQDRFTAPLELAREAQRRLSSTKATLAMTTGPNGSYFFPGDADRYYHSPAFADGVVDATGAGDAFFALTSLLVKEGCPDELIPFLGNVFAGLKTKIMGNKSFVTKPQLLKSVASILK
jgi:bifunctional ADP-heptose synthase (sugar kinase/adenylyltransferase)